MSLTHVPDLDSLVLLIRVSATGSLGQAAAEHGISQPAVSARVKSMERLVGFPLVSRSARGSTLTAEGALLAGWAREVLHAADILDAGIASLRQDRQTRLRVAASLTVAEYLLPRWLVRLAASHPDTAVQLSAMNSAEVAVEVLNGGVDLGFVEGPRVPAGLDSQVVGRDRLVVVVPPAHPWARLRRPLDPVTLAHTRLVQREPLSGTRTALELALRSSAPLATPLLELSSSSAVRGAVAAGAGPAVLSDLAVRDDVAAGRVVAVPVRDLDLTRSLRAVWPRGQRPTGSARDLLTITRTTGPAGSVGRPKTGDGKMGP
ncbi:MAG: hypothetical protein QOF82_1126 [Frankiales bacterium]|nr:hypothetical protein [Frankiales bacterium]